MNVLVIAPHPDDEVLGCGGTILKHVSNCDAVYVAIATKGCEPLFCAESVERVKLECMEADRFLGVRKTIFMDFPAAMIETVPRYELNGAFIKLIQDIKPDVVYLPHHGDMQLDHKMVTDAAMVALRPKYSHMVKKILTYETLSETGWNIPNISYEFIPNVYVNITDYLDKKIEALAIYKSQIAQYPNTRSMDTVRALALLRGSMMNMRAAEAFSAIREITI